MRWMAASALSCSYIRLLCLLRLRERRKQELEQQQEILHSVTDPLSDLSECVNVHCWR